MIAEVAIGRRGRGSALTAMKRLGGPWFGFLGAFAVITSFLIVSYYSVVGGWCVSYLVDAFMGNATSNDAELLKNHFNSLVSDGTRNTAWHLVFLSLTCGVVIAGVEQGIERLSKYLMPTLFVLMLAIIVRGLTLPGAWEGVVFLFDFSFEKLTASSILNAMGFTFFSLSLGAGILVTYGSYLSEKTCIPSSSMWVAVLAIQAALLAGLMIMPAVFAFGLEPNAGPGLVFITVPMIFGSIPFGDVFAALFYICLLVAALTSSVSLLEVVTAFLQNEWHLSRRTAVIGCWISLFFLGAVSPLVRDLERLHDCRTQLLRLPRLRLHELLHARGRPRRCASCRLARLARHPRRSPRRSPVRRRHRQTHSLHAFLPLAHPGARSLLSGDLRLIPFEQGKPRRAASFRMGSAALFVRQAPAANFPWPPTNFPGVRG